MGADLPIVIADGLTICRGIALASSLITVNSLFCWLASSVTSSGTPPSSWLQTSEEWSSGSCLPLPLFAGLFTEVSCLSTSFVGVRVLSWMLFSDTSSLVLSLLLILVNAWGNPFFSITNIVL